MRRRLPDFLVLGAQRSGTTSLYAALAAHKDVSPATRKEIHFFDLQWERGVSWYRSHFPRHGGVTGEATPYYLFHPGVPARAAAVVPSARLVVILRDPVDRAVSHHRHASRRGNEHRPLRKALEADAALIERTEPDATFDDRTSDAHRRSYVRRGLYARQLRRWLQHFDPDQLLVVDFDRVVGNEPSSLGSLQTFLGLDRDEGWRVPLPTVALGEAPPDDVRAWLGELYQPHDAELRTLLGRPLAWDAPGG